MLASEERASATARQLQASEAQLAAQQDILGGCRTRLASAEARAAELCVRLAESQQACRASESRAQVLEGHLRASMERTAPNNDNDMGENSIGSKDHTVEQELLQAEERAAIDMALEEHDGSKPASGRQSQTCVPFEEQECTAMMRPRAAPVLHHQQRGDEPSLEECSNIICSPVHPAVELADVAPLKVGRPHAHASSITASSTGWASADLPFTAALAIQQGAPGPREILPDLSLRAPRPKPTVPPRHQRYGQLPAFQEVKDAYDSGKLTDEKG